MSETEVTTEAQVDVIDDLDAFSADFFSGKSKAEPEDAKPEEAEQDDDQEGAVEPEAQTEDPDAEKTEEAETEVPEVPLKKKSVQDRIDEVVRQREDAKREAAAELAALRKEFEDKIAALTPKQPEPVASTKADGEPTPDDLNEDGTPKYGLGEFDPQYVRDLTKFAFAQERAKSEAETIAKAAETRELEARQALTSEWNGKVETAKVTYPDFQEKAVDLLNGFNSLEPAYAGYLSTVLMQMDHGTDVLYYLSNNPDEAAKIVNSGAQKATLALGRIEAKFYEVDQQKQAAKPKVSKAPPPPTQTARGTNGAFIAVAPDTDDLDAFTNEFFKGKRK